MTLQQKLINHFIKDAEHTENPLVRERYGRFASLAGIGSNFLLFVIKITTGLLFHSLAITADAFNNLSDSSSSLITLAGFRMSGKPADEEHPFGHERMEYIAGLIVSFLILALGIQLLRSAYDKIVHPRPSEFNWIVLVVLLVSIAIKLWQHLFYRSIGKTIHSMTILATAADSRNDVLATSAVLVSALISQATGVELDGYMGAAVALFILVSGVRLILDTISPLLGLQADHDLVARINERLLSYEGIIGIHDLTIHSYGPTQYFASVHCEISADVDPLYSHDLIDNIERDFLTDLGIHLVIHMDPVRQDDPLTEHYREMTWEVLHSISPQLSMHDFRLVPGVSHSNLIFDVSVPFSVQQKDSDLILQIQEAIARIDPKLRCVIQVDRGYVPG
jgi:cation diffusion facilitator family transporter